MSCDFFVYIFAAKFANVRIFQYLCSAKFVQNYKQQICS